MSEQSIHNVNQLLNINNELKFRRKKLTNLRKKGIAFPNTFRPNITSDIIYLNYNKKNNQELKHLNIKVIVSGRIISCRIMGKVSFVTLQDIGGRIQLYITQNKLTKDVYIKQFKEWDLGDIIGAHGILFKTKTGELSINCIKLCLITKALRPLPNKFNGLVNKEIQYRKRYLDLIVNEKSRKIFKIRSQIITLIRNFMIENNFMEVETPIMQIIPGGASARPFITHHNTLNIDMYLRVSPELYLKRLVIGGFERVFEINRIFRNEGTSTRHNPEFSMIELYMAYADYYDLMKFTESLFRILTTKILGTNLVQYNNTILNFKKPFEILSMKEAIKKYRLETNLSDLLEIKKTINIAQSVGITIQKNWGLGRIITEIFEKVVENKLIQPTFITEYPTEVSPLARKNDINPEITDRFELFIGGQEIGNGFSELNDSEDQAKRFYNQLSLKNSNNNEWMFFDEDYITALEYGLPPTAGLGMGIDRIVMILTNTSTIKDVILFPTMKPEK